MWRKSDPGKERCLNSRNMRQNVCKLSNFPCLVPAFSFPDGSRATVRLFLFLFLLFSQYRPRRVSWHLLSLEMFQKQEETSCNILLVLVCNRSRWIFIRDVLLQMNAISGINSFYICTINGIILKSKVSAIQEKIYLLARFMILAAIQIFMVQSYLNIELFIIECQARSGSITIFSPPSMPCIFWFSKYVHACTRDWERRLE